MASTGRRRLAPCFLGILLNAFIGKCLSGVRDAARMTGGRWSGGVQGGGVRCALPTLNLAHVRCPLGFPASKCQCEDWSPRCTAEFGSHLEVGCRRTGTGVGGAGVFHSVGLERAPALVWCCTACWSPVSSEMLDVHRKTEAG